MPAKRKHRPVGLRRANGLSVVLTPSEREVFGKLGDLTLGYRPRQIQIGYTELAQHMNMDRRWVREIIWRLVEKGYVAVLENYGANGVQEANTYCVVDVVTGTFR